MNIDSSRCKLLFTDPINSESAGILLRSRLQSAARRMGYSDVRRENMALVASELVTNLIKHAGGKGVIQIWEHPDQVLDLVSFDYGPGVNNLALAQQDGYSTSGTLGKGLGSMQRLSDEFAIFSQKPHQIHTGRWHGTAVWCRFHLKEKDKNSRKEPTPKKETFEYGMFTRSLANDRYNGDHIYLQNHDGRARLLHLDGLGHGESAQLATVNLGSYVTQSGNLKGLIETVDRHLRTTTRGAVAVSYEIDPESKSLHLLGVGDMGVHLWQNNTVQHFSFAPGVLGREHKTPVESEIRLDPGSTVISTSDGIRRGWDAESFPGLFNQHPQLLAYVLGNAMARITDDQSVCAVRLN